MVRHRSVVVFAACVVVLAACSSESDAEGDIDDGAHVVTEATDRLADAYADLATAAPNAADVGFSAAGCANAEERATRQVVIPIEAPTEPVLAAADIADVWSQDNADLDPGGDGRGTGVTLSTFATEDDAGTTTSFSETSVLRQEGYAVTLSLVIAANGANGATVVIDAHSDCLATDE